MLPSECSGQAVQAPGAKNPYDAELGNEPSQGFPPYWYDVAAELVLSVPKGSSE